MTQRLPAMKGHGTENDFIVIPDLQATLSLSPALVRALCDRRAGIGADGVLRVVRTTQATEPDVRAQAGEAEFFMDYRNADGSIAEMCGNGVRVFARYLSHHGQIGDEAVIATRGGTKPVHLLGDVISVDMGPSARRSEHPDVSVVGYGTTAVVAAIDMPNPHVVVELPDVEALESLDLTRAPLVEPALPEGQNVEFVVRTGPRSIRMRVHERGVGETRSCGTGICAAVVAVAAGGRGSTPAAPAGQQAPQITSDSAAETGEWQVDIPGGRCTVSWTATGSVVLTGPAVLVSSLDIEQEWLAEHR